MNEARFTGLAGLYDAHRPTYPDALADYLYHEVFGDTHGVIADIGAGTGIFSELLLSRGSKVFAVEPNADMMQQACSNFAGCSRFIPVSANAENTTLAPQSVDHVTVAQAFHWFNPARFAAECRRILKPGGKVVLVWNSRVSTSPMIAENARVIRRFCPDFPGFSGGMEDKTPGRFAGFFKNGTYEEKYFPNPLVYDEAEFIGRNLSSSYAPREADENYGPYIRALQALFKRYCENGLLHYPMETRCYIGEV